jgi:hypothetical protein
MTRLVQIQNGARRAVALVEEPRLRLLEGVASILQLAQAAADSRVSLPSMIQKSATGEFLDYDPIYQGQSPWRLLPAMDHPAEPSRCLVSGTGLTHLGSAKNRQAMHSVSEAELNDSMKMFRWGRQARARQNRHRTRMVLQGHGNDSARAWRTARRAALRRRRRRRRRVGGSLFQ